MPRCSCPSTTPTSTSSSGISFRATLGTDTPVHQPVQCLDVGIIGAHAHQTRAQLQTRILPKTDHTHAHTPTTKHVVPINTHVDRSSVYVRARTQTRKQTVNELHRRYFSGNDCGSWMKDF